MSHALAMYFYDVLSQGEYLSDWLTHMPPALAHYVKLVGMLIVALFGL